MSFLRTFDRTSAVTHTTSHPIYGFLCPRLYNTTPRTSFRESSVTSPPRRPTPATDSMDNFFIQALARAASCHEHRRQMPSHRHPIQPNHCSRRTIFTFTQSRAKSTGGPLRRIRQFAKDELKALVDYYGIELDTRPEEEPAEDLDPGGLLIWNVGDDHEPWPTDEVNMERVTRIEKLLEDEESPHDQIFELYKSLPKPRVAYLTQPTIRTLLHHLSIVERPDQVSMQRFLSILDDMKYSHIHISRSEWTSAIYLAGSYMEKVPGEEVQSALHIWRDMEQRAGIKGRTVTFNVLFDLAVRAGKYTLAETFLQEMKVRDLKLHRHFRVSLLYYYGIMRNGNGVRDTYQRIVSAGDIVDTVVMNSVIAGLMRAGEPSAAEQVFERMKRLHASKAHPRVVPQDWRERRKLGLLLTNEGRRFARDGNIDKQKAMQAHAPIAPDSRTYGLIIRHHAATAGNIDRVQELLQEMDRDNVPMDGTTFIVILYGFASFGGVRYSSWTRDKLERHWSKYLKAVRDGAPRTWLSALSINTALRAFKKCSGEERTWRAWKEARALWSPSPQELEKVLKTLKRLVPAHPFFDTNL